MQRKAILTGGFILFSSVILVAGASANTPEAKPRLNLPEKPSESEQRTVPKPGQGEEKQPPPDVVGKVPKDLKKAGKENETRKLLPKTH
jgi:hypothetical protein